MRFGFTRALLALAPRAAAERKVFAHYMLGLTSGQTLEQWSSDISLAQAAGIDGFALNAGPSDSYGEEQVALAYAAAEGTGFVMFISFDMCCGSWTVDQVAAWINATKDSSAQLKVDGKPFVSTFEGPSFASSWASVIAQTGEIFLVPDWTSLGPAGLSQHLSKIFGAFSWDAWSPNLGPKTNASDIAYIAALSGKPYMMGVSPFFYTNLPEYGKNWLWGPDTLWYDRWEQVLDILPEFVQIISWNDYGESHYIGPLRESAIVPGARGYVSSIPHDALQFVLPYYTAAYKAGSREVHIESEGAVFWYRTSAKHAGEDGGTTVGPQGNVSAVEAVEDAVFVLTLSNTETTVEVGIGGVGETFAVGKGAQMVNVAFAGRTGVVRVGIKGKWGTGPKEIVALAEGGRVNFNPVVARTGEGGAECYGH